MKRLFLILMCVSLMVIGFSLAAHAGTQDFTLVNKTGVDIHRVYVAPSNSKDWENDVLGKDILPNGESTDITFTGYTDTYFDLRIEDKEGNSVTWEKINLKEVSELTIYMKGDEVWYEAK